MSQDVSITSRSNGSAYRTTVSRYFDADRFELTKPSQQIAVADCLRPAQALHQTHRRKHCLLKLSPGECLKFRRAQKPEERLGENCMFHFNLQFYFYPTLAEWYGYNII